MGNLFTSLSCCRSNAATETDAHNQGQGTHQAKRGGQGTHHSQHDGVKPPVGKGLPWKKNDDTGGWLVPPTDADKGPTSGGGTKNNRSNGGSVGGTKNNRSNGGSGGGTNDEAKVPDA